MRFAGLLVAATAALLARTVPAAADPPALEDPWSAAVEAAQPDLRVCAAIGAAAGVFGDVEVRFDKEGRWRSAASRSLGRWGGAIERCALRAMRKYFRAPRPAGPPNSLVSIEYGYAHRVGRPRALLPPAGALLPAWHRLVLGRDRSARAELLRRLPPDYSVTREGCLVTGSRAVRNAELLWLPAVGTPVPPLWISLLAPAIGAPVTQAMWQPAGAFVVRGSRGLCLVPFDAARQAALRRQFETVGTCWVGGFVDVLLRPRFEFPADRTYTSVGVRDGRACGVTSSGEVVCCGAASPPLPPAPAPVAAIALGRGFACGLDERSGAVCWGDIAAPPAGPFRKLSAAAEHVCGLRPGGALVCWGAGAHGVTSPPPGRFLDVAAAASSSCAVRRSGAIACWGAPGRERHPPGSFVAVAADETRACGLRLDGTPRCWGVAGAPVLAPTADRYQELVVGEAYPVCGRRLDGTVSCQASSPRQARLEPPPAAPLISLAGDRDQICGVRLDGRIACFGGRWPTASMTETIWPPVLGPVMDAP